MLCPNCKKEIVEGAIICPECGSNIAQQNTAKPAKQKKTVTKKWWFWVLIVLAVFVVIGAVSGGDDESNTPVNNNTIIESDESTTVVETTEETTKETTTEKTTMSESDYKESCVSISYKDIARQPDSYKGTDIMFTGEVMQVQESNYSNKCILLIHVTKNQYGYWDDLVYVTYTLPDGAPRILEDDIVNFYGECEGTYTYGTAMGSTNTVPRVAALYIDIQ